ncbi:hypothetical protein KAT21_04505 [Candidatus Bathyarchaeota archaeon]|nr:hypothetical protein [Candidatus Bathyarchaeota archaeon]
MLKKTKNKTLLSIILLIVALLNIGNLRLNHAWAEEQEVHYWGLIVQGYASTEYVFEGDSQYMYHLMSKHYMFDGICYLAYNTNLTGVTNETTKENADWAITEWLNQTSGPNDIVFIFFATHGVGYWDGHDYNSSLSETSAILDDDGDEGNETHESTIGFDVTGDDDTDDWFGVDEALLLSTKDAGPSSIASNYTDDELAKSLSSINCSKLIFATTACFSGGFIDDLSATDRIIMTAANETDPAERINSYSICSPFAKHFMDALHGEEMDWNPLSQKLIHSGINVNADLNDDDHVSLLEAWNYSWYNNPARLNVTDIPWIDDNGNGRPTYKNETDDPSEIDEYGDGSDGSLANETYLPIRYYDLTVKTLLTSGQEVTGVNVWLDGILAGTSPITLNVTVGGHDVQVPSSITWQGDPHYYFYYWDGAPNENPTYVQVHENKTITAYYIHSPPGCPFVYAWNGTDYVIDNNLLAASAWSGGEEVEDYYKLEQSLVPMHEGNLYSLYSLKLGEFQQEHSYLDQTGFTTVDHDAHVKVAVSPFGEILTYQNPSAPVSAVDEQGNDQIEVVQDIDNLYYESYNGSYLTLDFGEVDAEDAKLILRADPPDTKLSIHVQVLDLDGNWIDVVAIIPRAYWATEIIDLSSYLPDAGGFKVRLYFTYRHRVDYVGLDTTPQAPINVQDAQLLLAYHSDDGVVTRKLLSDDDVYAELEPGEQIWLLYVAPSQSEGQRSFIIYTKGYYFTIDN